jgi:hypothetical protein
MQGSETATSESVPNEGPKRPRRLGVRIAAITAAVVIWILLIVGIFVWRYNPLSSDTLAPLSAQQSGFSGSNGRLLDLRYGEGQTTGYLFDLRNSGRFGVRINAVTTNGPGALLQTIGISMSKELDSCCSARPENLEDFHPFTLGAGHSIGIVVRGRFANCDRFVAGSSQTFDLPTIAYKIVGITKHQKIGPWQVRVTSPPDSACPSRGS